MESREIVRRLEREHGTRNPYRIAEERGMILIQTPLVEMRGFCQVIHRRVVIYINSGLEEQQQRLVCGHELGHYFHHRGYNRIFMDRSTYMVSGKYEREAHQFGLELVYSDEELEPFLNRSITDGAQYMGVTVELAAHRMGTVCPRAGYLVE